MRLLLMTPWCGRPTEGTIVLTILRLARRNWNLSTLSITFCVDVRRKSCLSFVMVSCIHHNLTSTFALHNVGVTRPLRHYILVSLSRQRLTGIGSLYVMCQWPWRRDVQVIMVAIDKV